MIFKSLKKPLRRIQSFVTRYAWIARDGLRGKKILVITITALSMAAAAVFGLTLGLSGKIINILQSGANLNVPYVDIYLQGSSLIISAAVCISALLALASYAGFYGRLKTRALARAYYAHSNARMLELVENRTTIIKADKDHEITDVRLMINRNAMHISRSLEKLVMMLQPICYGLAAVVTASYINFKLSIFSYLLLLFLIVPLYRKSSEFNENSRMFFQKSTSDMNKTLRKYINYLEASSLPIGNTQSVGKLYISEPTVSEYLDRFDHLRLAPVRMILVTSLFMAFIVGMGMLGVGYMLMFENEGVGTALAFMGALILLLKSLQNLGTTLALLNRFYPQTVDYLDYYWELKDIPEATSCKLPDTLTLNVVPKKLPGSVSNMVLYPDKPVNLICDQRLNRSNLSYIGGTILDACDIDITCRMEFAARVSHPVPLTTRDYLLRFENSRQNEDSLVRELEKFNVMHEIERLPDGLQTVINEEIWSGLSRRLASLLLILPLSITNSQVVIIDYHLLHVFDRSELLKIVGLFSHCYLFVLSNSTDRILEIIDSGVIIQDGKVIGAGGTAWLKQTGMDFELTVTDMNEMDDETLDDME